MEHPSLTYQQLLAEQYEENAKDLLVYQQTNYDNVEEYAVEEHNAKQQVGEELVDPHEFQRFGGARGSENVISKTTAFDDKGNSSVRRAKDVKNHIFNIDTLFRPFAVGGILPASASLIANKQYKSPSVGDATATTSHFIFNLDSQYKNIISAELTNLQIPNKFFNLVDIRNNYYIYTKKGSFTDVFTLPIISIGPDPKHTYTIIKLGVNISPLIAGDMFSVSGMSKTNYNRSDFIVIESTISTIKIAYINEVEDIHTGILTIPQNTSNSLAGFTRVSVYITSVNQDPRSTLIANTTEQTEGQTGFYYSNTSIIPAINTAYGSIFPDLKFTYLDGFCNIVNSSKTQTYTINITSETTGIYPAYFHTLGNMLGFYNYIYQIQPEASNISSPCNIACGQLSACSSFGNVMSENKIDMNADSYIQLAIQNWDNVIQQDGADSYYGVFQKIPINVQKGDMIYDTIYNNSITKKYDFLQPTNVRYLEIYLYDRLGYPLLMPDVNWSMALELEEVLNSALYDKLREL